jgi:hypothetical protein
MICTRYHRKFYYHNLSQLFFCDKTAEPTHQSDKSKSEAPPETGHYAFGKTLPDVKLASATSERGE